MLEIPVKRLDRELPIPSYAHEGDAGCDLYSAIDLDLDPGERALVPLGFRARLPVGIEAQIRPRSGTSLKTDIVIANAPGTIDADYRGEVGVILVNFGHEPFTVNRGDRIAQMVVARVARALLVVDELSDTGRGDGGFGHTG